MLVDTKKLISYLNRYKARCDVVRNPGYQAAMITCDDVKRTIERLIRKTPQGERNDSAEKAQPCGEHNKSSFQFPKLEEVIKHLRSIKRPESRSLSEHYTLETYNFIVGNKKR